ncbi:holo-[acyl-carrier-protein] synthase [Betaproteobacteria bacterium]|nr:holo-[acyl-carrier-protein] synthase [Betaproteobacteria bacterium]GHT93479.1 holo-[acyl-carrier-protein] synthase [Betaproteobacteria bacterium]GHU01754.1 holo-[acyl-carrier-protein] synthase [Betaproteobacteria bacterium]GHU11217.1 holo-[acyl-carrier-protein] synthase [Betaproteobacteria bacterium]GHU21370.1 holo-[acyl-carrier-protein] synthase [Betaproteobacteria bacterium]
MIFGIGTDIVSIDRLRSALVRHGDRFALRVLAESEHADWRASRDPARFVAKRLAAKEAFGKALGTGVAEPATLRALAVLHDARGKPVFACDTRLAAHLAEQGLSAHLSLTDEQDYVVAFAVIEQAR